MSLLFIFFACSAPTPLNDNPALQEITVNASFSGGSALLLLANPDSVEHSGFGLNESARATGDIFEADKQILRIENEIEQAPRSGYSAIDTFNRDGGGLLSSQSIARSSGPLASGNTTMTTDPAWDTGTERGICPYTYGQPCEAADKIDCTLRLKRSVSVGGESITLYIWIADDWWSSTPETPTSNKIDNAELSALADAFLPTSGEGIYHWVTDITGQPWGTHPYGNVIAPDERLNIHIVVKDISMANTVGYFWSMHNFLSSKVDGDTNQGLYFFLDSVFTDSDMDTSLSTLGHEFQHMVHYYQKVIARSVYSETWLNELASMAVEDLLADKIRVPGPRELPLDGGSYVYGSGSASYSTADPYPSSRLSYFNTYPDRSIPYWSSGVDVMQDYAISYTLGAYLMRAYSGPDLIKDLLQNGYGDQRALTAITTAEGGAQDWGEILLDFAEAVARSSNSAAEAKLRMNNGASGFSWTAAETDCTYDYQLGSIDLSLVSNLYGEITSGPTVYVAESVQENAPFPAGSIQFLSLGSNLNGEQSWTLQIPTGMEYRLIEIP